MNDESSRDYCYWNISKVVSHDLKAVPIRSYNNIEDKGPSHDRGRQNYKPWFVTGRNSASNIGVAYSFTYLQCHSTCS